MCIPIIPALVLAVTAALAGCAAEAPTPSREVSAQAGTDKMGSGELRTDLAPLIARFDELADAESAQWSSGSLGGDDRVPGPSTSWIDAVVVLPQSSYDAVRSAHEYAESAEAPSVADALAASVPAGPLLVSDELDQRFGFSEGSSDVYLDDATHSLVISSRLQ